MFQEAVLDAAECPDTLVDLKREIVGNVELRAATPW